MTVQDNDLLPATQDETPVDWGMVAQLSLVAFCVGLVLSLLLGVLR